MYSNIRKHKGELEGRPWSPAQADGWHFYTFIQLNAPFYWTNVGTNVGPFKVDKLFFIQSPDNFGLECCVALRPAQCPD